MGLWVSMFGLPHPQLIITRIHWSTDRQADFFHFLILRNFFEYVYSRVQTQNMQGNLLVDQEIEHYIKLGVITFQRTNTHAPVFTSLFSILSPSMQS